MKKELTFMSNQQTRYNSGRAFLLLIVVFSAVNLITTILADTYFLFSAYLPQLLVSIGAGLYLESDVILFYLIAAFLAACTIAPYLICYIFSKKHVGWMITALVLFAVDSFMLLIDFVSYLMQGYVYGIADLVIHAISLVVLAMAVSSGVKAKNEGEAAPVGGTAATVADANTYVPQGAETFVANRTLTLVRKKSWIAMAMPYACFADDKEICRIKNGETVQVEVSGAPIKLGVMLISGSASTSVMLPAGDAPVTYEISIKSGLINNNIVLKQIG